MAKLGDVVFTGASGVKYTFKYYSKGVDWKAIAAVYVFTKRTVAGGHGSQKALYIGETHDLDERIPSHEKWDCVEDHGCTHIAVLRESDAQRRRDIESDLIREQDPPCNDQ